MQYSKPVFYKSFLIDPVIDSEYDTEFVNGIMIYHSNGDREGMPYLFASSDDAFLAAKSYCDFLERVSELIDC